MLIENFQQLISSPGRSSDNNSSNKPPLGVKGFERKYYHPLVSILKGESIKLKMIYLHRYLESPYNF